MLASVPLSQSMTVWAVALERQFGWTRTEMGIAMTLARIEGGMLGPLEGYLTDRIGTRRMVMIGLTIGGLGFLLFSQVQNIWMFYLAYIVMALGQGFASWVPMMTMLNHWFSRRRAIAIGWSNAGGRFGALLVVPAIAWAIDPDQDRLGWQLTAMAIGMFILVVVFPLTRLIRNRPQEYGLLPDGAAPTPHPAVTAPERRPAKARAETEGANVDFTLSQALRTPAFWFISFGHGCSTIPLPAIWVHLGLLLADAGFQVQTTAWVVATYTGLAMVFQLVGGYVGSKIPVRLGLFIFTTIQAGAVLLLMSPDSLTMIFLFAVLLGIGWGGRNPMTVTIRGEYFGRASFGSILGFSTLPMNIMMLFSAPFAGYIRDTVGTYNIAFLVLAAVNFIGGILFFIAKKPSLGRPAARRAETMERGA
ncbi:MAG: MFS transporter [Dehalococcoidia bacterium]|nr:MFS transporter [Dehalococcoidia bacterium]